MRKKEEILLCNASRTYIDWNVTFRALRKRALNVNATATTILKNFTLYRNSDNVRKKAEDALEKVKGAVSNTTAALVVADSFMNGIELDFFNAFEAIKGSPQNYIFGHSNMHDEKSKRRISEVQTFFDDIKIFFSRCNATNNGKAETLESMEKAVMDVVDQAVNLSSWKKRRVKEWNKTLNQVESWLHDMKNYTGQSSKTNIWNYSVTIWNITRTDCGTIEKGNTGADSSVKLVEAAYDNVIRHLRDIANESFISSVEENGCNETYSHFRTILAESLYNKTYDKNEIKEMCKKIKNKKEESCASAKTSFQWIKERFKVAVPKMIENLNYSLTELINAEKVAQEAAKSIAAEAVGHVCNAKGQADVFSAKHNAVENFNVNVETNISLLIASLDGVEEKLTNALNKTNSALNILSASASDVKALEVAHNDSGVQKESQLTVEDARAAKRQAEELAKTLKTASSELKHHNNNLDASLREKNAHLKDIAKKVSVAINVTNERQENNGEFGLSCEGIDRVLQNVTTDKAIDIIKKLEKDNLVNTAVELNKTLQKSEGNVSSLDGRISQMNANFSLAKSNTESALNRLHDVVQKSQNFQRAALAAVVELLNKNKSALCALQEELTALSIQNETVSRRSEKLVEDISGIKDAASKLAADAAVSMHNCTSVAKLAKEAALLRPGATGADDKAQYAEQNCTLAVQEVSTTNEKALAFVGVATGAKNDAVKLQGQLTELIREKKKRLEKTKGTFAEMLKNASVKPLKVENTCEAVNFSEYVTTFEQAEKIFPQLRGVDSFGVDDVKRNITALEGLVSSAEANLSRAQSNVVLSKESSKNAEKYASEVRVFARAVFKDVMETQRRELCNAVQRLVETNQRASVVISQANDNRNNARRQRDRAKDALGVASGAAARSASADAHTSEVPGKLRETSDVVTGTLVLSRSVMRDGKKLQKENEVQVQEIHKTIASVLNNVTDRQGAVTENVCAAAMSYSVTGALKDSLDAVKTLASLGNITGALTRFDYLQGREKQVEAMLNASKERADGAERGALAALKVAKDARSTLLFFHLFRTLNNLG